MSYPIVLALVHARLSSHHPVQPTALLHVYPLTKRWHSALSHPMASLRWLVNTTYATGSRLMAWHTQHFVMRMCMAPARTPTARQVSSPLPQRVFLHTRPSLLTGT